IKGGKERVRENKDIERMRVRGKKNSESSKTSGFHLFGRIFGIDLYDSSVLRFGLYFICCSEEENLRKKGEEGTTYLRRKNEACLVWEVQ
ncbi:hypothetical protein U1Q18_001775, partial [Sarracenia purpurea var. burkii]